VIGLDTNLLVYAHRADYKWHDRAKKLLKTLAEGQDAWAVAWPCLHEFISIVTNPRFTSQPTPPAIAFEQAASWSRSISFRFLGEGRDHLDVLEQICRAGGVTGGAIHDARIAAICIEHGVKELWTADRDFSRFPSLKTRNPLVG
jgi:uncharacterized protein